jgi:hypothetical protein
MQSSRFANWEIEIAMMKLMALVLTLSSAAAVAHQAPLSAWNGGAKGGDREGKVVVNAVVVKAPEMDATTAASALTLLLGGVMVMRSRATKR